MLTALRKCAQSDHPARHAVIRLALLPTTLAMVTAVELQVPLALIAAAGGLNLLLAGYLYFNNPD